MAGFGSGPFGKNAFGQWPWGKRAIVDGIPGVYKDQDELAGDGSLGTLLEALIPSLDGLRRKIRDFDQLRDPLRCPVATDFQKSISVLKTVDLGDGTSRVFLSEGPDGDKFDGLRVGMVLIDSRGLRFTICQVTRSGLPEEVDDPPVDPATGMTTGKYVVVANIGQSSTEFIPFVTGTVVTDENPVDPAAFVGNSDDGTNPPPYVFNVEGSDPGGFDIALNRVTLTWEEGGDVKSGFFVNTGSPGGDLADTSEIDYSVGAIGTGQIILYTASGAKIDLDTIRVSYTQDDIGSPAVEDAEIRAQNILTFLASDRGQNLDQNDPEIYQRAYVNHAFKIWDIKGTADGYRYQGELGGYFVEGIPLYAVTPDLAASFDPTQVFAEPEGAGAVGSIVVADPADLSDGETFTLSDGVNPPVTFELDDNALFAPGNIPVNIGAATTADDVAIQMRLEINGATFLNLSAAESGDVVTITNTVLGEVGNVSSWSEAVASPDFRITQPTGGTDPQWFSLISPSRLLFDEVAADVIPLDTLCSEASYPTVSQAVTVDSVEAIQDRGSEDAYVLVLSTGAMEKSFGTFGTLTDAGANDFEVESYERLSDSTYQITVHSPQTPVVGAGTLEWRVLRFEAPNSVFITGIGTDVVDLGRQAIGFTGRRYRITKAFTDPPLSSIGNWIFIDFDGVASYIERFEYTGVGSDYEFEIVSDTVPATGSANIYVSCSVQTDCSFCAASAVLIRIVGTGINAYPDSIDDGSFDRISGRVERMVPGHVNGIIRGILEAPVLLSITPGDTTNTLTWSDVDGAISYNIYWSLSSPVDPGTANKITGVSSPYVHTGLTNGVPYYYAVVAVGV